MLHGHFLTGFEPDQQALINIYEGHEEGYIFLVLSVHFIQWLCGMVNKQSLEEVIPLSSSTGKLRAPLRFSKLSKFSCLSSVTEGRFPAEPAPALDLDMESAPRPLFDGDDRNAV